MFIDTTRANRPVYSDVWYPVDAKKITSSAIPAQYALDPFSANLPISTSKDWEILGYDPAYEGPAPSHGGPFPLLVFSPGFDDDSWQQLFIGTRLASHGYVVAVLDHYADCQWSWSSCDDLMTIAVNRPHDASFAIRQLLLKGETPGVLLFGSIDSRRIAMGGHSWGGYATYALTGGDDLVCDALWPAIVGDETLPYPPSTCVPVIRDRRIRAMISLDGSSQMMRYEEFSRISEPSLIMGETVEQLVQMGALSGMPNPEQFRTYLARPHAAIDRSDSYRVDVDGANHYSFTNYCDGASYKRRLGRPNFRIARDPSGALFDTSHKATFGQRRNSKRWFARFTANGQSKRLANLGRSIWHDFSFHTRFHKHFLRTMSGTSSLTLPVTLRPDRP